MCDERIFYYDTEIGTVGIAAVEDGITRVMFSCAETGLCVEETALIQEAYQQLTEYLAGKRQQFTVPLLPKGTPFQQKVWQALREIPYGTVASYGQIAAKIGNPKAARAVGMANHENPIAVMIPCHRVVGQNGTLTGYAGGLEIKAKLLYLEGVLAAPNPACRCERT